MWVLITTLSGEYDSDGKYRGDTEDEGDQFPSEDVEGGVLELHSAGEDDRPSQWARCRCHEEDNPISVGQGPLRSLVLR